MCDFILGILMEDDKKNLDNPNQCKSIYKKIVSSADEWVTIPIMLIVMLFAFGILMLYLNQFGYIFFLNDKNSWETIIKENIEIDKIDKIEKLGQVGDFIGGTLNPLFALFSFMLLLMTVKIQNKSLKNSQEELKLTREELARSANAQEKQIESIKIQNFETTFFNLINLHNKLVDNFSFEKVTFEYIQKTLKNNKGSNFNDKPIFYKEEAFKILCKDIEEKSKTDALYFTKFNEVYNEYYRKKQNIVNKYFENIHQIFKFISNSKFNENEKKKYSDMFRVQFSQDELKLLFYHCIGDRGSITLKPYVERFNFFEFLILKEEDKNFLFILNKSIYNIKAFGDNSLIVENIKKLTNEYLELNIDVSNSFDNYKKYCSYCFILEKYELALEKLEKLEKYYEPTIEKYASIDTNDVNMNTIEKNYKILKSYIVQIKKYLNTSSQEQ